MSNELLYKIALTRLDGIGNVMAKTLISYSGGVEEVFKSSKKQLMKIPGVGEKTAQLIRQSTKALAEAERECLFLEKHDVQSIFFLDKAYPQRLKNCIDAPVILFYRGNANFNQSRVISVVGTRNATSYGKKLCFQLAKELAKYEILVVSGLAFGIDYSIHKACVEHNIPTVAVLGHGMNTLYPAQHLPLANKMIENGGLLTEFLSGTKPDRQNFPQRNRIVAGMTDATIVVETAQRGGSIITAQLANSYHRDVYAFPGRVTDSWSVGCNWLIKKNMAGLVESPEDIALYLGWEEAIDKPKAIQKQLFIELSEGEEGIVNLLKTTEKLHIDQIIRLAKMPNSRVAAILLGLELKGVVKPAPGSLYQLM